MLEFRGLPLTVRRRLRRREVGPPSSYSFGAVGQDQGPRYRNSIFLFDPYSDVCFCKGIVETGVARVSSDD